MTTTRINTNNNSRKMILWMTKQPAILIIRTPNMVTVIHRHHSPLRQLPPHTINLLEIIVHSQTRPRPRLLTRLGARNARTLNLVCLIKGWG